MRDISHPQATQASSATVVEFPAQAKTPRQHTHDRYNRFVWRDDVFADKDVSAPVKCLAFGIAKFIDHETGKARVGTRALAQACGNSQTWVAKTLPLLAATGWMQVLEKGRRGSGDTCAGVYKMNRTREHAGCSLSDAVQTTPREHFSTPREHTGCSDPLLHKSAPPARSSEFVDTERAPEGALTQNTQVEQILYCYPGRGEPMRQIVITALSRGMTPEQIYEATAMEDDPVATLNSRLPRRNATAYAGGGVTAMSS